MRIAAVIVGAVLYAIYAAAVMSRKPTPLELALVCPGTPAGNTEEQDHVFYATQGKCK